MRHQKEPMKVLMISRGTLYSSPGGDTIQMESTAKYLRRLGVEVDIRLANDTRINYQQYDLLHLFNMIRPNDLMRHVTRSGKPFVLSTIYVDYSEYERNSRTGLMGMVSKVLNKYQVEYVKVLARAVLNNEQIASPSYITMGQKKAMLWLLRKAACLLPNSLSELKRIEKDLNVRNRYEVIPNAIDRERFGTVLPSAEKEGVLCVARIEGLKNQLNLIRAVEGLPMNLLLIGKVAPNHTAYYTQCREAAGPNVFFRDHIPQEELPLLYAKARVHILPSWFETTGLSSLEAGYLGCNLIVTRKGDTEEYFGDLATYCEPDDVSSIREALLQAYQKPLDQELRNRIEANYIWEVTARKTCAVYRQVVTKS
jgi:glycosyltransferase involved in cell wall biosynthesis